MLTIHVCVSTPQVCGRLFATAAQTFRHFSAVWLELRHALDHHVGDPASFCGVCGVCACSQVKTCVCVVWLSAQVGREGVADDEALLRQPAALHPGDP